MRMLLASLSDFRQRSIGFISGILHTLPPRMEVHNEGITITCTDIQMNSRKKVKVRRRFFFFCCRSVFRRFSAHHVFSPLDGLDIQLPTEWELCCPTQYWNTLIEMRFMVIASTLIKINHSLKRRRSTHN